MAIDIAATDELLTTTRGVRRRLDFDKPVDPKVIEECVEIALQSPVGSVATPRHFIVITDDAKKTAVADCYRKTTFAYLDEREAVAAAMDDPEKADFVRKNLGLARRQAEELERNPALIILAIDGRIEGKNVGDLGGLYGSILPAAWSLMLALRARGLGSCWTTLHLYEEKEVATILGIPEDVTQAVLLPVAYFTGDTFKPAKRLPAAEQIHWNGWGQHRQT